MKKPSHVQLPVLPIDLHHPAAEHSKLVNVRPSDNKMQPTVNLLSAVLPILGVSDRLRPTPVGTGFLLQVADLSLLVSAAHVADANKHSSLYIPPGASGGELIELPSAAVCTKPPAGKRKNDKLDLAFWELPAGIRDQLNRSSMFIPSKMLLPGVAVQPPQNLSLVGFPHKSIREKFGTRTLQSCPELYTGICLDSALYSKVAAYPGQNLAISFDPKQTFAIGKRVTPKDRRGMSGGPVLAMTDGGSLRQLPRIRVVGVVIEWHRRENLMLATKIDSLLTMLSLHFQLHQTIVTDARISRNVH